MCSSRRSATTVPSYMEADLIGDPAQVIAEFAIHRLPNVIIVEKSIADAKDPAGRVLGGQQVERQCVHFECAGDRLRDHRGIAAEQAVGVKRDVEPPATLLLDERHGFAQTDRHRMAIGERAAAFKRELGRAGRPVQGGGGGQYGCQTGEERPARQLHRVSPSM